MVMLHMMEVLGILHHFYRLTDLLDLCSRRILYTMPNEADNGEAAGPSSPLHPPSVRPWDPQEFAGTHETDVTD